MTCGEGSNGEGNLSLSVGGHLLEEQTIHIVESYFAIGVSIADLYLMTGGGGIDHDAWGGYSRCAEE